MASASRRSRTVPSPVLVPQCKASVGARVSLSLKVLVAVWSWKDSKSWRLRLQPACASTSFPQRRSASKPPPAGNKARILVGAYWRQPAAVLPDGQSAGGIFIFFSLWTGRTGCNPTQSSWRCRTSGRRTPLSPVRRFSERGESRGFGLGHDRGFEWYIMSRLNKLQLDFKAYLSKALMD